MRSERLRARELTLAGVRKNKFLRFWCTYTVLAAENSKSNDPIEKTIKQLQTYWQGFTGEIHAVRHQRIETILKDSFTSGFQMWEQIISNTMGLSAKVLTASDIWEVIWNQFNRSEVPPSPIALSLMKQDSKKNKQAISISNT